MITYIEWYIITWYGCPFEYWNNLSLKRESYVILYKSQQQTTWNKNEKKISSACYTEDNVYIVVWIAQMISQS